MWGYVEQMRPPQFQPGTQIQRLYPLPQPRAVAGQPGAHLGIQRAEPFPDLRPRRLQPFAQLRPQLGQSFPQLRQDLGQLQLRPQAGQSLAQVDAIQPATHLTPQYLAHLVAGQLGQQIDPAGHLVGGQPVLHRTPQFLQIRQ